MNKEFQIAIIGLTAMLAIFAVWQPLIAVNNDKYSVLAVLGPNQTLGGYPSQLVAGHPFQIYGYVQNQEGITEYYQFVIKLGNQATVISNTTSANAPVIYTY